jgi:nucleoside-diphosphate-sugar epimerase/1-acyl-sn-glycerol-3-phosphate acyltransferase
MTLVADTADVLTPARRRPTARVAFVAPEGPLARELVMLRPSWEHAGGGEGALRDLQLRDTCDSVLYVPRPQKPPDLSPDLGAAERIFESCARAGVRHVIVVSSVAAYGASPHHAGLVSEQRTVGPGDQPVARSWLAFEALARAAASTVTVLRAAPVLVRGGSDFFSQLFAAQPVLAVAGHDPTLQLLGPSDLARAIDAAAERQVAGLFNIVPTSPISLHAALRLAGRRPLPMPWSFHKVGRALGGAARFGTADQAQFLRYHLTASGEKAAGELGFVAHHSSADAVRPRCQPGSDPAGAHTYDPFGLDREYIERSWRGVMGFLHRRYWRVESSGLEHIPRQGGAVLVGMHRGFMPFDGVMTLHSVVQGTGRVPRFLIHPGVGMRFPFLFNLMSKLGGVIACQENANRILESGQLLGVYPEGIRGAFTMYTRAHRIGPSWRNDCVAFALRHGVPIVPFVTIGSAEIFPIVGRIDWRWWKRFTEWPFIPVTTPFPLPSKWHTAFLEPLHVEHEYGRETADDPRAIRAISTRVKRQMEEAVTDLRRRRRSLFFGSIGEGGSSASQRVPSGLSK